MVLVVVVVVVGEVNLNYIRKDGTYKFKVVRQRPMYILIAQMSLNDEVLTRQTDRLYIAYNNHNIKVIHNN